MVTLNVTNVGTVTCREVVASLPEDGGAVWLEGHKQNFLLADLRPGQRDGCKFFASWNKAQRFEIQVGAIAEDGEPVKEYVLYSSELLLVLSAPIPGIQAWIAGAVVIRTWSRRSVLQQPGRRVCAPRDDRPLTVRVVQ